MCIESILLTNNEDIKYNLFGVIKYNTLLLIISIK